MFIGDLKLKMTCTFTFLVYRKTYSNAVFTAFTVSLSSFVVFKSINVTIDICYLGCHENKHSIQNQYKNNINAASVFRK